MPESINAFRGKVVLVVEDEPLIAMALSDTLEDAGASVLGPVSTVAAAMGILQRDAFDGALLDINLRGEQSYKIAEAMAALERPFVFLSSLRKSEVPERFQDRLLDKLTGLDVVGRLLFSPT